jgi:hypothetical protein
MPDVDGAVHECQRVRGSGTRAHAEVCRPPRPKPLIVEHARSAGFDTNWTTPVLVDALQESFVLLRGRPEWIILCPQAPGVSSEHHEGVSSLRIRRREQDAHRTSLGDAQERRALRSGGVQHSANVVHPLLQGRKGVDRDPIRQACAALVEQDQPGKGRQTPQKAGKRRLLPRPLKIRDPALNKHQGERSFSEHLVRDVSVPTSGVLHVRNDHPRHRRI